MGIRTRALVRAIRAVVVLTPLIWTFVRDTKRFVILGGPRRLTADQRRDRARRLTDAFEALGITYIKLAQFLTTRPDLVPPIYMDELTRLQDDVEPESSERIRAAVEDELGPIDEVFDEFDPEPLSGASIGQVHRAVADGREVAVKVRRPGIVRRMEADMVVMSKLIPIAVWWLERSGEESHAQSAEGITSSLDETIRQEMSFERERGVMDEIRGRFAADGLDDRVVIPQTFPEYSTDAVLTMSYEAGVKITDLEAIEEMGYDVEEVVDVVVESYLRMPFVYQCFQADPHHGNLAVDDDGRVIIYDFGIAERPDDHIVEQFVRFLAGLGMKNAPLATDALVEMGAMDAATDRDALEAVVGAIIQDIAGGQLDESGMREVQATVDQALYDYPLRLNKEIVLAMRTVFGVEGLCAKVAPEYDFTAKLFEFFVEEDLIDQDLDTEAVEDHGVNVEAIKREIQVEAEKNGQRIVRSVAGGTLVVSGAVVASTGVSLAAGAGLALLGGWSFLTAARSFGDDGGSASGPLYATRYNMEEMADDETDPSPDADGKRSAVSGVTGGDSNVTPGGDVVASASK